MIDALPNDAGLLQRRVAPSTAPRTDLLRTYQRLSLKNVDLGFAGRYCTANPVHPDIQSQYIRCAACNLSCTDSSR
jgi:hypothetical protein